MQAKDVKDLKESRDSKDPGDAFWSRIFLKSFVSLMSFTSFLLLAPPAAAQCTLSTTGVSFGTYDLFSPSPLASTGSIAWSCPPNRTIEIHLGTGSSGSFLPRKMANGAEHLSYNLYLDPAGTRIWGDGTGGTSVLTMDTGPGTLGKSGTVPIYGRIPAQQDVSAGVYTDTVVVTIWL
jgi:spore coat protein U-like protein